MRRSERCLALVAALLMATTTPAMAQTKSDKKRAVQLSRQAIGFYRSQDYEKAGELFLQAYELSRRPAQLRNAAKAFEEGAFLDRALELWQEYKALDISRDERSEAEAHVALIREKKKNEAISRSAQDAARAAEEAAQNAADARRAAEEARKTSGGGVQTTVSTGPPTGGWVLVGAGAVMVVTGVALWFISSDQLSDLDALLETKNSQGLIIGTDPEDVDRRIGQINSQRIASGVLWPVGLAAVGGGVLWLLLGGNGSAKPSVAITPDGASAVLSGQF